MLVGATEGHAASSPERHATDQTREARSCRSMTSEALEETTIGKETEAASSMSRLARLAQGLELLLADAQRIGHRAGCLRVPGMARAYRDAAVHREVGAGDEACRVGRQEQRRLGDVPRQPRA